MFFGDTSHQRTSPRLYIQHPGNSPLVWARKINTDMVGSAGAAKLPHYRPTTTPDDY
jgi:hypothetical protein